MDFPTFVIVHWFVWLAGIICGWWIRVRFEDMNQRRARVLDVTPTTITISHPHNIGAGDVVRLEV